MTEYIKKEQAIDEVWDAFTSRDDPDLGRVIEENIERLPAADVVPVVRCKDCKYAEETYRPDIVRCTNFSTYHDPWKVWRGWYCGDGERREGECK